MWGINYLAEFDTLMVQFSAEQSTSQKTIDRGVLFFNDTRLVSANLFQVSNDVTFNCAWLNEDDIAIAYIAKRLSSYKVGKPKRGQFMIGRIVDCAVIEGTHLHITKVDFGNSVFEQIICGADNVGVNKLVVGARTGAFMINGLPIVPTKLKGHDSNGMLVSKAELGIADAPFNDKGIIILDDDAYGKNVGASFWQVIEKYETKF